MEKFPKLLENHKSFSCDNVIRKDERERFKKRKDLAISSQAPSFSRLRKKRGKVQRL